MYRKFNNLTEIPKYPEWNKLKREELTVELAKAYISDLNESGSGVAFFENGFKVYEDFHWKLFSDRELEQKIGAFALKIGVPKTKSDHVDYRVKWRKEVETLCDTAISSDNSLINLLNGTVEVLEDKVVLREHRKEDYLTYVIDYEYDPNADCPKFKDFMNETLPEEEKQLVLSEFMGSALDLNIKHEKVLLCYGGGANGKSVFTEIVSAALGSQNVCNYSLGDLTSERSQSIFRLADNFINISTEISGNLNSSHFKKLASGEPIKVKMLYQNPYIMRRYARMAFNCNVLPFNKEHTEGFYRRWLIIPFEVHIPEEKQNKYLPKQIIQSELPGVLNWIIKGLIRLKANGGTFTECESCNKELSVYRISGNSVASFLDERYIPHDTETIPLSDLYEEYKNDCVNGNKRPVNIGNFWKRMEGLGFSRTRRNKGYVVLASQVVSSE